MKHLSNARHLSLLYFATHMPAHIPPAKNRWRIFLRPIPTQEALSLGNIAEHGFDFSAKFSGFRDRPYRNFTTAVAEGKMRGHVRSKTQLHVLPG